MPFLFFAAIALIGAAIHDNHDRDNTGLLLWSDFIAPLVAIALYAARQRAATIVAHSRMR